MVHFGIREYSVLENNGDHYTKRDVVEITRLANSEDKPYMKLSRMYKQRTLDDLDRYVGIYGRMTGLSAPEAGDEVELRGGAGRVVTSMELCRWLEVYLKNDEYEPVEIN